MLEKENYLVFLAGATAPSALVLCTALLSRDKPKENTVPVFLVLFIKLTPTRRISRCWTAGYCWEGIQIAIKFITCSKESGTDHCAFILYLTATLLVTSVPGNRCVFNSRTEHSALKVTREIRFPFVAMNLFLLIEWSGVLDPLYM